MTIAAWATPWETSLELLAQAWLLWAARPHVHARPLTPQPLPTALQTPALSPLPLKSCECGSLLCRQWEGGGCLSRQTVTEDTWAGRCGVM